MPILITRSNVPATPRRPWKLLAPTGWVILTMLIGCEPGADEPMARPAEQTPLPTPIAEQPKDDADTAPPPAESPPVDSAVADAQAADAPPPTPEPRANYAPPDAGATRTYVVRKGDTLQRIAATFYGDKTKWRRIYQANRAELVEGPDRIVPGMKLVIP